MLQTINNHAIYKSIYTKNSINWIDDGKIIVEVNSEAYKTEFSIPKAELFFAKLRHAFDTPRILHHFNLECYISIETDGTVVGICRIFCQLT